VNRRQGCLRSGQACAPSRLKVDFGHLIADAAAELDDLNVIGMHSVVVEGRPVAKARNQARVVRIRRMQYIDSDRKTFNSRDDGAQRSQALDVIIASIL
jgi:hypothetical protein